MRALIIAIGLVLTAQVSAAQQTPQPPALVTITKTVTWTPLDAMSCEPICQYRVELDGQSVTTVSAPPATFPAPLVQGVHVVAVTAIDGQGRESVRSIATYYESNGPVITMQPCTYQAPVTATNPNPPMETRPLGQMMQGFNPIGTSGIVNNQADRIRQLEAWGWRVVLSQFVEGNLRPDRIDRLFLIVQCKGLTP